MKKKFLISSIAVAVISVGSVTGVYAYNKHVEAKEAAVVEQKESLAIENAKVAVKKLNKSLTQENIDQAKSKVELVNGKLKKSLEKEVEQAEKMFNFKKELSGIISNDVIKKGVTSSKIKTAKKSLAEIEKFNKEFSEEQAKILSQAEKQLKIIDDARAEIKSSKKSLARSEYNKAAKLVKQIKNKTIKDELNKELGEIDKKIDAVKSSSKPANSSETSNAQKNESSSIAPSTKSSTQNETSNNNSNSSYKNNTNTSRNNTTQQPSASTPSAKSSSGSTYKSSGGSSAKPSSGSTYRSSGSSTGKSSSGSTGKSSSGSTNKKSSGGTDWDQVGKDLENKDWSNTGSGEIDKGGNTWDSWK